MNGPIGNAHLGMAINGSDGGEFDFAPPPTFKDRLKTLRRRLGISLVVFAVLLLATVATALLWPPEYRSVARILIEDPEVPPEMVASTIVSFGDKRIETINQRVMTSDNLLELIKKYELYPEEQRSEPREELLELMRDDLDMKILSADIVDSRSGRAIRATIAFELSYENESSLKAYRVANELTTLYLNENLKNRTELAGQTSAFLNAEAEKLAEQMAKLSTAIETARSEKVLMLPELLQANAQMLDRADRDLEQIAEEHKSLDERRVLLEGQLAQTSPRLTSISPTGERVATLTDAEEELRVQAARMAALYSPNHPDLIRTRELLAQMESAMDPNDRSDNQLRIGRELARQKEQLHLLKQSHSDQHPDVQILEQVIVELESAIKNSDVEALVSNDELSQRANNPAWLQLNTQIKSIAVERDALLARAAGLRNKRLEYEQRLAATPIVEAELRELYRDYENTQRKHADIRNKQLEAELAESLEQERKGERFTLLEPAVQPERPEKPNRPLILWTGAFLSVMLALGSAFVAAAVDPRIQGPNNVNALLNIPMLGAVPYLATVAELHGRRRWQWIGGAAGLVVLATLLVLVHFLWMPLDTAWFSLLRRLDL